MGYLYILKEQIIVIQYMLSSEITVTDLIEFIDSVNEIYSSLGIAAAIGLPYFETLLFHYF